MEAFTGITNFEIEQSGGGSICLDWSAGDCMGSISINQTSSSASLSIINPYISNLISYANISGSQTLGNETYGLSSPVTFDSLTINGEDFNTYGGVTVSKLTINGGDFTTTGSVSIIDSLVVSVESQGGSRMQGRYLRAFVKMRVVPQYFEC